MHIDRELLTVSSGSGGSGQGEGLWTYCVVARALSRGPTGLAPPGGHLWTEIGGRKEKTSGGAHVCRDAGFTHTRTLGVWTGR